jgi:hypothetical protein
MIRNLYTRKPPDIALIILIMKDVIRMPRRQLVRLRKHQFDVMHDKAKRRLAGQRAGVRRPGGNDPARPRG